MIIIINIIVIFVFMISLSAATAYFAQKEMMMAAGIIFITGMISLLYIAMIMFTVVEYQKTPKEQPKFELIQEPVYKRLP